MPSRSAQAHTLYRASFARKPVKRTLSLRETVARATVYEFVIIVLCAVLYLCFPLFYVLRP